ncbi:MAG: hypothetical protein ACOYB3_00800 [Azonexus sp.]
MANEFVQREGIALLDIELRVSDTKTIPVLGQTVILHRAEITEVSEGISTATFFIQSATRDYVDKLLKEAQADKTPRIRWRLGIGFPEGAADWLPWQDHIVRSSGSALEGLGATSGYMTILKTADILWEIDRINRVAARKGKISEIVQQIADSLKLPSVIEPTKTNGLYYQSYLSDYEFIKQRMVPRALNDKKRGNYQFYLRDGTLHFHTIDYQAELKDFIYYNSPGSKLTVQDHSQELLDDGSSGVRVVYYDPYSGEYGAEESKPESTLRLSNTSPDTLKLKGAEKNIMVTLGTNRDIDSTSIAANVFEKAKAGIYTLSLTIPKTVFFRASDLLRVTIQPDNSQVPPSSGTYHIVSVVHNVDKTSLVSEITLRRGEFLSKDRSHSNLENAGEPVIQPRRGAVGQDPNFKSVASSSITKGSGKQMSRTVVLDTLNPNLPVG